MEYRSIEIDFDIHKIIETNRTSFEESPNEVLRRILKLQPIEKPRFVSEPSWMHRNGTKEISANPPKVVTNGTLSRSGWHGKGVDLPNGTLFHMEYNGEVYSGDIQNGKWCIEGAAPCKSPSDAACSAVAARTGIRPSLNGWIYWHVKRPQDNGWVLIDSLRTVKGHRRS